MVQQPGYLIEAQFYELAFFEWRLTSVSKGMISVSFKFQIPSLT